MPKGCTRTVTAQTSQVTSICSQTVQGPWVRQVTVCRSPSHKSTRKQRHLQWHHISQIFCPLCHQILSTIANLISYQIWILHYQRWLAMLHLISLLTCINCSPHKITFGNGYWRNKCICKPFCPMRSHIHLPAEHVAMLPVPGDVVTVSWIPWCAPIAVGTIMLQIHSTWLFQVGLILHLGHDGEPCPSYLNSLPPEVFAHNMEAYEDDIEDVTEGDGSSNVIKELKRFTGLYALGSTIFSTPINCHWYISLVYIL